MPERRPIEYRGVLFIGDPHLSSRVPGFRRDDYPRTALGKLAFCLEHAREQRLLPAILGDLFDLPRDNANWLLGEVLELLAGREVAAISGNHDVREDQLSADDSLSVLVRARSLRLVDREPWRGVLGGRPAVLGGTSWGARLPKSFDREAEAIAGRPPPLVLWMAHHDVILPGYEEAGRFRPREIPGIDVVVNGHIHRRLEEARAGATVWITPGNICRISRSDAGRSHRPSALQVEVDVSGWRTEYVEVPHRPFEEVFHAEVEPQAPEGGESAFVRGLAELVERRTQSGAGLLEFLESNLGEFDESVGAEVRSLAKEVIGDGAGA